MRPKTIHRSRLTKNFTTLPNELLQNNDLSHLALGLLCRMLSLPPDWETCLEWIYGTRKEGKQAMQTAIKELQEKGYLKRTRLGTGKILWEWFDTPSAVIPSEGKASEGFPPTTKDRSYKGVRSSVLNGRRTKDIKGVLVPKTTCFRPKFPYPQNEEEMYNLLELHGIETTPDYDAGFFHDATRWGWKDPRTGDPIYDWVAFYDSRTDVTFPGKGGF